MRTHLVDLLVRQDKMTMGHGVENRVPFLDRHVIDFARALPAEHLVGPAGPSGAAGTKLVVKELARRSFDEAFVYRRKSAFNLPLAQYFRSARFVALMEERLLPGMCIAAERGWLPRAQVLDRTRTTLRFFGERMPRSYACPAAGAPPSTPRTGRRGSTARAAG